MLSTDNNMKSCEFLATRCMIQNLRWNLQVVYNMFEINSVALFFSKNVIFESLMRLACNNDFDC